MRNRQPTGPEWRQIAWCLVVIAGLLGAYVAIRPIVSPDSIPTVIGDQARIAPTPPASVS